MPWTHLSCHPASRAKYVHGIEGTISRVGNRVAFRLRLYGQTRWLELPDLLHPGDRRQRDELWRSTCFEAFIGRQNATEYVELNLNPAGHWAVYRFDGYREGMRAIDTSCRIDQAYRDQDVIDMTAAFELPDLPVGEPWIAGLSAVVEAADGAKSYWALAHGNPDKPDFHDPACFVLELPPA